MHLIPKTAAKKTHLAWMCALFLIAVLGALSCLVPFAYPSSLHNAEPLTDWRYITLPGGNEGVIGSLNQYVPFDTRGSMTLTRRMTEQADDPHLLLRLTYLRAQVYLDDSLLFENLDDPPGENPGSGVHLIKLPDDFAGRELKIVLTSPYTMYAFSPDPVYFGDAASLFAKVTARSAPHIAIIFLMVIGGLMLMGISLFGRRAGWPPRAGWANCCFGLFAVLYGLSLTPSTDLFWMAFPPLTGSVAELAAWYLFPLPLMCYLALQTAVYKRTALALAAFWGAMPLIVLPGALLGLWALPATLAVTNKVFIAGIALTCIFVALEAWKKNTLFRFLTPAFALLLGSAAVSVMGIATLYTLREALRLSGILALLGLAGLDGLRALFAAHRKQESERQLVEVKTHLAAEQLKAADAHNQETRLLRHEIRHHLAAMTVLQREGRLPEIGEYLSELIEAEENMESVVYCEHALISAILRKAGADCERAGIVFTCQAHVPSRIPLPDADLSTLLYNMFENAVDAAHLAPEGKRWIAAQVRVKEDFLVVVCQNARQSRPVLQNEGRFLSTKDDPRLHGYGILAMQRIAEKHGSKLNIDYDSDSFTVKTILRLDPIT